MLYEIVSLFISFGIFTCLNLGWFFLELLILDLCPRDNVVENVVIIIGLIYYAKMVEYAFVFIDLGFLTWIPYVFSVCYTYEVITEK